MKIPNKIKIMGHDYTVIHDPGLDKTHGKSGQFNAMKGEIHVDTSWPSDFQGDTVLHEVIEALKYHLVLKLDHDTLSRLSEGLYQVLKDNNMLR